MEKLRGCRAVGSLTIHGDITSLAELQSLESATTIRIVDTSEITSLSGLENLRSVVGNLTVSQNKQLDSLAGLGSLQTAGHINISWNAKLRSMAGLESLRSVENLTIQENFRLESLVGLESLVNVGDTLFITSNHKLRSLLGLQHLQTVNDVNITRHTKLESLVGLENIASVRVVLIDENNNLRSLSGLDNLQTAEFIEIRENEALESLHGLGNLKTLGSIFVQHNSVLRSVRDLNSLLALTGSITINSNKELVSLGGLEGLTSVGHTLFLSGNDALTSLSGLDGLQTAWKVKIQLHRNLITIRALGNLTTVETNFSVSSCSQLRTLEGLERLRSVEYLEIGMGNHGLVSLYPGLQSLEVAAMGIVIWDCRLRSLHGLGSLRQVGFFRVEQYNSYNDSWHNRACWVTMQILGGPFVEGASVGEVVINEGAWPRCVTPHERMVVQSTVPDLRDVDIPEARCETRQLIGTVPCTKGHPCEFSVANFSVHPGGEQIILRSVFLSGPSTGCAVCPQNHLTIEVDGSGMVNLGYALRDERAGLRSLCACSGSDPGGPVGQLYLRGPTLLDSTINCMRGHTCTIKFQGEGLERTDRVVLMMGNCDDDPSSGFSASWSTANEYVLRSASGWFSAPLTRYQVCWRAPCSTGTDQPVCPTPEHTYFNAGEVELLFFGPFPSDYTVVLGKDLSAVNVGIGVLDGDLMRLMRTCGEANEGGKEALEAVSFSRWFHFGALTADRVQAGRHSLCWCQERQGDDAVECKDARDFMWNSGVVLILCPAGQQLDNSSRHCEACPAGRQQLEVGLEMCTDCPPGRFSHEGARECTPCEDGTVAETAGRSACAACRGWEFSVEATACSPDPKMLLLFASFPFSVGVLCWALVRTVRTQLSIVDVSLDQESTLVTTFGPHGLSNFGRTSIPVVFHDTGHPGLDKPGQPLFARVKDAARLELLPASGSTLGRLDTSQGKLKLAFPYDLYHQGWPLPAIICLPGLFVIAIALGVLVVTADMAAEGFLAAAAAALIWTAASTALRLRPHATPLRQQLAEFKRDLAKRRVFSIRANKGADRAVTVGQLHRLLDFFHPFIRDRTAYFLTSNIIVPLTKEEQLSYAELVGPGTVKWFVSHFWGTAFQHFCASLQKHAEAVCNGGECAQVRYWVCFCSNNQHKLGDELGSGWEESSFYVTLRSGQCQGTCMVLDDKALPLTRIWCIFELLQTVKLQRSNANFGGLIFCTSGGVLNTGSGSVEVAMALAKKVADMNLATAEATSEKDANMIRAQVIIEMGSFDALNRFVCQEVYSMLARARSSANQQFAGVLAHLEEKIEERVASV